MRTGLCWTVGAEGWGWNAAKERERKRKMIELWRSEEGHTWKTHWSMWLPDARFSK